MRRKIKGKYRIVNKNTGEKTSFKESNDNEARKVFIASLSVLSHGTTVHLEVLRRPPYSKRGEWQLLLRGGKD